MDLLVCFIVNNSGIPSSSLLLCLHQQGKRASVRVNPLQVLCRRVTLLLPGFKSVFAVADKVSIASGPYTFSLDRREALGMITPTWEPQECKPGLTLTRLDLSRDGKKSIGDILRGKHHFDPMLLLFLRKLRRVAFNVSATTGFPPSTIEISRKDFNDQGDFIQLGRTTNGVVDFQRRFIVVKHEVDAYPHEAKREGIKRTAVVLAFPVDETGVPERKMKCKVHAFLPLANYGLPVSSCPA